MRPRDAYRTEKDIAIMGRHLMRVETNIEGEEANRPARLMVLTGNTPAEGVACACLREAAQICDRETKRHWAEGGYSRDLPELFGLVVSERKAIEYWIAPNGRIWSLIYLGKETDAEMATEPLAVDTL